MLSICIPNFNQDVRRLVHDLHASAEKAAVPFEIWVLDDASKLHVFENEEITELADTHYVNHERNLGRAGNRNYALTVAKYDYLLFLDGDAEVIDDSFINNYEKEIRKGHQVICGGTAYQDKPPAKEYILRWVYGRQREMIPAKKRNEDPNAGFATFNFAIKRSCLQSVPFDDSLKQYGHEDTLLGMALERKGINIHHIDNPLIHTGLDENEVFLEKTKTAIQNLWKLQADHPDLWDKVKLLSTFRKFEKNGLMDWLNIISGILRQVCMINLTGPKPKLWFFDLFKLLYLSSLVKENA